jgi:hypothetical protein
MVPTDFDDVAVFFNDIGIGYWVYRRPNDEFLTGVIPTVELHVNTPLNHREANDVQRYRDLLDLTVGAHVEFQKRWLFGVAFVKPLINEDAFEFEIIANLNFRF